MGCINSSHSFFFFFLTLITLSLTTSVAQADEASDLIKNTCEHAIYKEFCISDLQQSKGKIANIRDLANITLQHALSNATYIVDYVSKLANTTKDFNAQSCFVECSTNYEKAISLVQSSFSALDNKDFDNVNRWLTSAMFRAELCEKAFKGQSGVQFSEISDKAELFNHLCSNALAIADRMAGM
ncbi:PREDICTED: uncharacterized protein LOC104606247 [Nelumbo nucifera]|uniref:Pectinesterase inhibitor domain-containing protein n=2 Tax=Nelumbo nucifera TaxID=4432 RepID=A0A822YQE3_NELNU|nr:PREDICTED: uncharacterized protein LOC104606247 [Nelumbo nucifera]DAD33255.1 TPA_asm: hypothetical protein HUJ06_012106 [Nelumbo nucifera]